MSQEAILQRFTDPFLGNLVYAILCATLILGVCALFVPVSIFMERKISAWMQSRIGPNRVGPRGVLQMIADAIKLIRKEDIMHGQTHPLFFILAPAIAVAAPFACLATIPFTAKLQTTDLNLGLIYVLAISSFSVVGILTAGYASNNRYSLIGAMRSAAQMVSYEIPMVMAVLGVVCLTGTLSFQDTVRYQYTHGWNILYAPISFLIFFIAGTAECNRAPFDLVEAESELIAGFHTEYSGMKFAMFFFGEYVAMLLVASFTTVVFLGGWLAPFGLEPFLPMSLAGQVWGSFWFWLKVASLIFLMMWFRWTFPRLRVDQLMEFCWKVLLPFSMVNLLLMVLMGAYLRSQ